MDVEEIVNQLGGFGKYQLFIAILAYITAIFCAQPVVQDSFINYTPDHRCFVPSCDSDNSSSFQEPFLNFSTPWEDSNWSKCQYYQPTNNSTRSLKSGGKRKLFNKFFVSAYRKPILLDSKEFAIYSKSDSLNKYLSRDSPDKICNQFGFDDSEAVDCDHGWVYDTDLFQSTTTMEFDLTCGRGYITSITTSAYSAGMFVGALGMGIVSDKLGRKVAFMISMALVVCGGVLGSLSVNALMLVLARVPTGIGAVGLFECAFILSAEFMPVKHRSVVGLLINVAFALGEALVGVYAIFLRDWRALQLAIALPSAVLGLYFWIMPESLRWLISKRKYAEARKLVGRIAEMNKVETPDCSVMEQTLCLGNIKNSTVKRSAFDLLRTPNMRKRSLAMYLIWLSVNMVYYGVSQNAVNLGGNVFVNFIGMMLIEIPSYLIAALLFDRLGHKGTLMATMVIAAVACSISGVLPEEADTAIVVLSMMGKFGGAAAFAIIYVYAAEIFPTEYRSIGVGSCSMFARIGGIISPLVASLGKANPSLPLLIIGSLALLAAVSVLFLPETAGCALPQTLEESERFGSDQSILHFGGCSSRKMTSQETRTTQDNDKDIR